MIFPPKQIPITIAKSPSPPSADFPFPVVGNLHQMPRGTLKAGNLEGLPPPRPPTPILAASLLLNPRCKIKACVFPASDLAAGMCHFHDLQEIEPELFQSFQPILYVLQQAKYGEPGQPVDDGERGGRRPLCTRRGASV